MKRQIVASILGLASVTHAENKMKFLIDDQRIQKIAEAHKLENMSTELIASGVIVPFDNEGHYLIDFEKLKLAVQLAEIAKDDNVINILQEIVGTDSKIMLVEGDKHESSTQDFGMHINDSHLIEKLVTDLSKKEFIRR